MDQKNLALQTQDYKPLQPSNNFEMALVGEKVKDGGEALSICLRESMLLVGIRSANMPNQMEFDVLKNFIQNNYGGHTVAEIRLAFEMAITGKLGVESNCFENFSCQYVSGIMNAYRKWASQEIKQLPKKEDLPQLPPAPVDWTSHWNDLLDSYRKGNERIIILPIYEWLIETGKLVLTLEDKKALYDKAKNIYQNEFGYAVQVGNATPQIKSLLNQIFTDKVSEDLKVKIGNRAKLLAVKGLISKIISE